MAASPQASDASPFSFQNQNSKTAALSHSTIVWLVVLACILVAAFIIIACLLCRCRRKRKDRRLSTGYGIYDGRQEFHPWNKSAVPMQPVPAYSGYEFGKPTAEQTPVAPPSKATTRQSARPSVMEPIVVEEASDSGFKRTSKETSRYYGGLGARISRMSQIGRAM
jgi:hypothetical protein